MEIFGAGAHAGRTRFVHSMCNNPFKGHVGTRIIVCDQISLIQWY